MDNNNTATVDTFITHLGAFVTACQANIDAQSADNMDNRTILSIDTKGRKYIRIVATTDGGRGQRSAFGFVERATGDVFKHAGWKGPAKNFCRGNIYNGLAPRFVWSVA